MSNSKIIETYNAGAAVTKHRIIKHGADDDTVIMGAAATDPIIGVTTLLDIAIGERIDVIEHGIAEVEFGGTVTRGGAITSDATGKAVAAAPASGTNNRIVGWAMVSAVNGDIAKIRVAPSQIQG